MRLTLTGGSRCQVMHRIVGSYTLLYTRQKKVYLTKGDSNLDAHALVDYSICEGILQREVVAKIPRIALPRVWSQTYQQVVEDQNLPTYSQDD